MIVDLQLIKKLIMIKLLLALCLLSSCTTTYYIVRHADKKLNDGTDPSLSNEGLQRAQDLNNYFGTKKPDEIFVSTALRTQQTAAPTAAAAGKVAVVVDQSGGNVINGGNIKVNAFIEKLKKIDNKNVLVVTHSDVIPEIIRQLAGVTIRDIKEDEYDNMYILTRKGKEWSFVHAIYGKVKLTTDVLHAEQPINLFNK
jgi:2,3-bisphosphoglycerate-dependent phosphoglycerate mutase